MIASEAGMNMPSPAPSTIAITIRTDSVRGPAAAVTANAATALARVALAASITVHGR